MLHTDLLYLPLEADKERGLASSEVSSLAASKPPTTWPIALHVHNVQSVCKPIDVHLHG